MEQFLKTTTVLLKAGWEGRETEVEPEDLPSQQKIFQLSGERHEDFRV